MRRAVLVVPALLLLLAGCGGRSQAEQQFLDELQQRGSTIELADPDGDLAAGQQVCGVLADTKPEERYTALGIMDQRMGYSFDVVTLAPRYLCPEVDVPGLG